MKLLHGFNEARQASLDIGAQACGISGSGPTLFACAISQTPRSAWRTGSKHTCKIRKALFIFAVWTRLAHEYSG